MKCHNVGSDHKRIPEYVTLNMYNTEYVTLNNNKKEQYPWQMIIDNKVQKSQTNNKHCTRVVNCWTLNVLIVFSIFVVTSTLVTWNQCKSSPVFIWFLASFVHNRIQLNVYTISYCMRSVGCNASAAQLQQMDGWTVF